MNGLGEGDNFDTLPPGTLLGRYEIRRLLGRGGMGCVYEATHRDLKKRVAIKTLLPALASSGDARQRFLREGEAASRIRHPHVVDVTDVGSEGNIIYLVMEYLEGEDLARLIARQGPLSMAQSADIMLPVAAAIATAHEQGVIHRDLKPENIFLARSGYGGPQPKVLDFGISKVLGDSRARALTGTAATMGTMNYLPPEQLRAAREADARSDQYGLGTILYECVTGQRAFDEESFYIILKKIAEGEFPRPSSRRPDLAPRMEAIILRAMSLEPLDRFESVKQLGAALLDLASDGARALWAPYFGPAPEIIAPATTGAPRTRSSGGDRARIPTMLEPAPPSGATLELPAPQQRRSASTTMRNATGERSRITLSPPRRSRAPLVIAATALVAGAAALIVLRGTVTPTQRTEPESSGLESPSQPQTSRRDPSARAPGTAATTRSSAPEPTEALREAATRKTIPPATGDTTTIDKAPGASPEASGDTTPPPAPATPGGRKAREGKLKSGAHGAANPTRRAARGKRGAGAAADPSGEPDAPETGVTLPNNAPIIP